MLLIVGVDSGSWELLDPWIAAGELPTFARIRRGGTTGGAESTVPPITFPAWTSFATASEPHRHGIFDFTKRTGYSIRFLSSHDRRVPSIWSKLAATGRRVCVYNLPGAYPPEDLPGGIFISGFDSPVTTSIDASFVHPRELHHELSLRHGPLVISDLNEAHIGRGWHDQALRTLCRDVERRTDIALDLLARQPWEVFFVLFGESDTAAHHFWRFADPRSPRYEMGPHARSLLQVYSAIDRGLARLLDAAPEDTTLLVVSDHGMGGAGTRVVAVNRYLESVGLLRFSANRRPPLGRLLRRLGLRFVPARLQGTLLRGPLGRLGQGLEAASRFAGIDWGRTVAFSEELNYFPAVWLNQSGREPQGTVAPEDRSARLNEVCRALEAWRDPETGQPIVARVRRREEIYPDSPAMVDFPDLVLDLSEEDGYSTTVSRSEGRPGPTVWRLTAKELGGAKGVGMNGSHRPMGFYGWLGPAIPAQRGPNRRLADLGTEVLARFALAPDHIAGEGKPAADRAEIVYGAREEAILEGRLRALGYLP